MKTDSFGDRMKDYEDKSRFMRGLPIIEGATPILAEPAEL